MPRISGVNVYDMHGFVPHYHTWSPVTLFKVALNISQNIAIGASKSDKTLYIAIRYLCYMQCPLYDSDYIISLC